MNVQQWLECALEKQHSNAPHVASSTQGWGELQHNRSIAETPLRLNGQAFERGLGTHAESEITLRCPFPMRRFRAVVGLDDNDYTRADAHHLRLIFSLHCNGEELWSSPPLGLNDAPHEVEVALPSTQHLTLKVAEVEGRTHHAHADWCEMRIEDKNGQELPLAAPSPYPTHMPLSFQWGDFPFAVFRENSERTLQSEPQNDGTTLHTLTYTHRKNALQCRIEATEFPDFAAVEWVAHFRNIGQASAPVLRDVNALDFAYASDAKHIVLHRARGSHGQIEDFLPSVDFLRREDSFPEHQTLEMHSSGGRSSQDWLPFFNAQMNDEGFFAALGWSGEWDADFRFSDGALRARGGMSSTHIALLPGEEIRTPRVALLFWEGDFQDAHNTWRRFILLHHTPRLDGKLAEVPLCCATWGGLKTHEHLENIARLAEYSVPFDCYWIDAGWHGDGDTDCPDVFVGDWGRQTGNWNVNSYRHPDGIAPISEAAHAAGMKSLLWFEPERAVGGTRLTTERPEWFFGDIKDGESVLLNLGNDDARRFITELLSQRIEEEKLDWYRQDFNIDPLRFWRAADADDRKGIAEIRHIEGLYQMWDELRARHPHLMIDNCASGGRRIDLETMGRSVPLWRSDYQCFYDVNPIGMQVQMQGLSRWIPLHTGGNLLHGLGDTYAFRSCLSPGLAEQTYMYATGHPQTEAEYSWLRERVAEQKKLRPFFSGDFYTLLPISTASDVWCASQFIQAKNGEGFVLVFRREDSPYHHAALKLRGLEPAVTYQLEDADNGETYQLRGEELLQRGLEIEMSEPRSSRLLFLRRLTS